MADDKRAPEKDSRDLLLAYLAAALGHRQIVSGIAWLELRHRGVDPPVERIVLALG